jgi:hypothetical protein
LHGIGNSEDTVSLDDPVETGVYHFCLLSIVAFGTVLFNTNCFFGVGSGTGAGGRVGWRSKKDWNGLEVKSVSAKTIDFVLICYPHVFS